MTKSIKYLSMVMCLVAVSVLLVACGDNKGGGTAKTGAEYFLAELGNKDNVSVSFMATGRDNVNDPMQSSGVVIERKGNIINRKQYDNLC